MSAVTAVLLLRAFVPVSDPTPEKIPAPAEPARREPASVGLPVARKTVPGAAAFEARLDSLRACYERRDCDYPHNDEKTYDFAVGQAMKGELLKLAQAGLQGPEVSALAAKCLEVEDGHVQEAALSVLAAQPPSEAALDATIAHVIGGYDAELIPAALRELRRYQAMDDRSRVAAALAGAMASGSPFVARAISSRVTPFVQADVRDAFETALLLLPAGSEVREELQRALR